MSDNVYYPDIKFRGREGQPSRDDMGPETLRGDLDKLAKMFNPNSVHEDDTPGGISPENLNFEFVAEMIDFDKIEGLVATTVQDAIAEVFADLKTHMADKDNPHEVTAEQVKEDVYGNVQDALREMLNEIAAEMHNRILNDDLLRDEINAEIEARLNRDDALQSAIDAESETRRAADSDLQEQLNEEITTRQESDAAFGGGMLTEANTRAAADAALLAEIDGRAPKSHASATAIYGPATETEYGHIRLAFDDEARIGERADKAITPKQLGAAIKTEGEARVAAVEEEAAARTEADDELQDVLMSEIGGRAPVSHASATKAYGPGTEVNYGHMRFATNSEAEAGTATDKAITPKQLGTSVAKETESRKNSYDLLQAEYENIRTDFEAFMGMVGTATWQDIYDNFPTWGDVFTAFDSWLRVRLYVA
jgi:hypothetical protein